MRELVTMFLEGLEEQKKEGDTKGLEAGQGLACSASCPLEAVHGPESTLRWAGGGSP